MIGIYIGYNTKICRFNYREMFMYFLDSSWWLSYCRLHLPTTVFDISLTQPDLYNAESYVEIISEVEKSSVLPEAAARIDAMGTEMHG